MVSGKKAMIMFSLRTIRVVGYMLDMEEGEYLRKEHADGVVD